MLLSVALLLFPLAAGAAAAGAAPAQVAIADFDFVDTSGEVRDQRVEHEARLRALMNRLRSDLAAGGKFRIIDIACNDRPCTTAPGDFDQALEQARKAGAGFVLFGAVQKTSTLILSLPVRVIDPRTGKTVFQRYHSFRGDTDEAWQRAGAFVARELVAELSGK